MAPLFLLAPLFSTSGPCSRFERPTQGRDGEALLLSPRATRSLPPRSIGLSRGGGLPRSVFRNRGEIKVRYYKAHARSVDADSRRGGRETRGNDTGGKSARMREFRFAFDESVAGTARLCKVFRFPRGASNKPRPAGRGNAKGPSEFCNIESETFE